GELVPVLDGRAEPVLDRDRLAPEQEGALGELARQILLTRLDLASHLVLPRGDAVVPRGDPEAPAAAAVDLERARVAIVSHRQHRHLLPAAARRLVANRDAEDLVAVAEHVGPDVHAVARRTLHREAPAVELRPDV